MLPANTRSRPLLFVLRHSFGILVSSFGFPIRRIEQFHVARGNSTAVVGSFCAPQVLVNSGKPRSMAVNRGQPAEHALEHFGTSERALDLLSHEACSRFPSFRKVNREQARG